MVRRYGMQILAGFLLISGGVFCGEAFSQSFPYSVPQAPEFDGRGNPKDPERQDAQTSPQPSGRSAAPLPDKKPSYREPKPYRPQPARALPSPPPQPAAPSGYAPKPAPPPAMASNPPMGPPQPQQAPDCSQFPMMIANARSEQEMQMTARLYLTCLMKTGWSQAQATQHVMTTVERVYKASR
jgi:hypothetical protein